MAQRLPGSRVVSEPAAVVRHRVRAARASWAYLRHRSLWEGRSKATVAALVGRHGATFDERQYVRRVLPRALARELVRGRVAGAAGILTALAWTSWGYLSARIR